MSSISASAPNAASQRIRVEALHRTFALSQGEVVAVGDVSFDVSSREFVSIIGPSGCGKSTVLNMIAGLLRPSSGRVLIDGEVVTEPLRKVGYVFQKDTTYPWKTVEQNIGMGLEYRGVPTEERRRRVAEMVKMAKLEGFEQAYPSMLSGGMRQRVALMRSFIVEPEVLLMDEPFGSLDTHTALNLHQELLQIWERTRQVIVFVTHNLSEAITLSDRVILLSHRPSQVKDIVEVNIPRPRNVIAVRETPEYQRIYQRLWHSLGEEFQQTKEAVL
jgi:NitT/TauT family transport system ATP-binding protein